MTKSQPSWPPTRADYFKSLLLLGGCVVIAGIAGYVRESRSGYSGVATLLPVAGLFGLLAGTILWLFLIFVILLPLRFIPILTSRREVQGRLNGNARRGRAIATWGFRFYVLAFVIVVAVRFVTVSPQSWLWHVFLGVLWLLLLSAAARGIKEARDFVGYTLVFAAVYFIWVPHMISNHPLYGVLVGVQTAIGVALGLCLLLSKDVILHLALESARLRPRKTHASRRHVSDRKRSSNRE